MATVEDPSINDEVVREVRRIKEKLAQAFDFDIDLILTDAREKQRRDGRKILSPPVIKDASR